LRVVAVEDIVTTSLLSANVHSRIAIYQLNEFGIIVSARIFDQSVLSEYPASNVVRAAYHYFDVLELNDIEKVRPLYAPDAVLEDPVGLPPRQFDSVYKNFYSLAKSFVYKRSPQRTFVWHNQVALVVDAEFVLVNGNTLQAHPVQVFSFNNHLEITHFEAFFKPLSIDFSKLH